MRQINIYDKGDRVYIEYEIDSIFFKNGQLYYKLKEPSTGKYLDNAYTAEELISVQKGGLGNGTDITEFSRGTRTDHGHDQ